MFILLQISLCDDYSLPVDHLQKKRPNSIAVPSLSEWHVSSPEEEKVISLKEKYPTDNFLLTEILIKKKKLFNHETPNIVYTNLPAKFIAKLFENKKQSHLIPATLNQCELLNLYIEAWQIFVRNLAKIV